MLSVESACVSKSAFLEVYSIFSLFNIDGVELMIIIIATFAQAVTGHAHAVSIIGVLVLWRFIMGIGIGGDYPLSAVISS